MLVGGLGRLGGDILQHDGDGRRELGGREVGEGVDGGEEGDVQAGLLFDFTQDGLDGVFVGLDVAAGGEPHLVLLMEVQQGVALGGDEGGDGEVAVQCGSL